MSQSNSGLMIQLSGDVKIVEFLESHVLDQADIEKIKAQVRQLIADTAAPKILISFEGVKQISSSLLGMVIDAHKNASSKKGAVRLSNINDELMQVFKLTKLDKLLKIFKTSEDALHRF